MVKFDIDTIDEDLLSAKETRIEDLEKQKVLMENRIREALGEIDLKVTNVEELSKKVKMF